jgi:UDP-N-acetylglucosamine pyrophosphorylase
MFVHCTLQLSLPVEVTTRTTYLNLYVHYILELQKRARAAGDNDARLPLIIMTSEVRTVSEFNMNSQ